jgi:hypothetical protein
MGKVMQEHILKKGYNRLDIGWALKAELRINSMLKDFSFAVASALYALHWSFVMALCT